MVIDGPPRPRGEQWLLLPLLLILFTGCVGREVVGPLSVPPPSPFSASGEAKVPDRWWTTFEDRGLNSQIEQAFGGNFQLAVALERLRAARAVTRREASDLFPDLDGVSRTQTEFRPGEDTSRLTWGLEASYQVDLWGEIQSRVEAERLRTAATDADYHAIALTLSGDIARTWFSLIEARAQLELLAVQLETNLTGLKLTEARFGLVGETRGADVLRQRQLVESTLEQEVVVQSQIEVLEHRLAVLLGQMPQSTTFETGAELPTPPPLPNAGLPSELLQRRPDVRRDYLAFLAADSDLASAISTQYPRINLTGSVLNAAEQPENLFRDWFVSLGGQLIAPLIDGGQRRAEVARTAAVVRQRFAEYGQTMLVAFQEVEDSLIREKYQLERLKRLDTQVELARQASAQLLEQYSSGDTDYLSVLTAITAEQRLQRETLSARLELINIRISLYLALAGDFEPTQQAAGIAPFTVELSPEIIIDE
ncbi:TolC family protein [Planctomycetaceae bacterium SH139]